MRFWILVAFLCHWPWAHLCADPFEKAEITRTVNLVSLLLEMKSRPAVPGDTVNGETAVRTGGDSRAELQFPDLTITRVGSNALFRFVSGGREITLDGGTMLFSSPKGAGGGKVQAGAITAAVTGTEFLISYVKGSGGKRGGAGPPLAGRSRSSASTARSWFTLRRIPGAADPCKPGKWWTSQMKRQRCLRSRT